MLCTSTTNLGVPGHNMVYCPVRQHVIVPMVDMMPVEQANEQGPGSRRTLWKVNALRAPTRLPPLYTTSQGPHLGITAALHCIRLEQSYPQSSCSSIRLTHEHAFKPPCSCTPSVVCPLSGSSCSMLMLTPSNNTHCPASTHNTPPCARTHTFNLYFHPCRRLWAALLNMPVCSVEPPSLERITLSAPVRPPS
jgi:hypothetical protein